MDKRKPHNTPTQQWRAPSTVGGESTANRRKPREDATTRITTERLDELRVTHPETVVTLARTRSGRKRVHMVTYHDPSRIVTRPAPDPFA